MNKSLDDPDDLEALDHVAGLTVVELPNFEAIRAIYNSDARFRMDGVLQSYIDGTLVKEKLEG